MDEELQVQVQENALKIIRSILNFSSVLRTLWSITCEGVVMQVVILFVRRSATDHFKSLM